MLEMSNSRLLSYGYDNDNKGKTCVFIFLNFICEIIFDFSLFRFCLLSILL